jgi:hypothetical protein
VAKSQNHPLFLNAERRTAKKLKHGFFSAEEEIAIGHGLPLKSRCGFDP